MISKYVEYFYSFVSKIPFDTLVWGVWGSYAALFLLVFLLNLASAKLKAKSKVPFLCLTNAYAAVTLALFLMRFELEKAVCAAALFWLVGYILYGALCAFTVKKPQKSGYVPSAATISATLPVPAPTPTPAQYQAQTIKLSSKEATPAKNNVRLDHAVSITDKLLLKNLGKSDKQELEKLKNTFAVLQIKGTLTPTESDILNENFNTLLKLMAKYNV